MPLPVSRIAYRRRVQFAETDASGIVHFTNFFKYVEEAEHEMWRSAGLTIAERSASGVGWPRVAASFEFRRPLRFEDVFEVRLEVAEKTKKMFRYGAELVKEGELIATGSLTIICVVRRPGEPMKATDMPADIADRFEVADARRLEPEA